MTLFVHCGPMNVCWCVCVCMWCYTMHRCCKLNLHLTMACIFPTHIAQCNLLKENILNELNTRTHTCKRASKQANCTDTHAPLLSDRVVFRY